MTDQNRPVINFDGYRISNLEYKAYSKEDYQKEVSKMDMQSFKVEISMNFNEKKAQIKLTINFVNSENFQIGFLTLLGQFVIDEIVDNEEEARQYLLRNGTAIMFPYVRAIVSMLTALDKGSVTVLPTLNFSSGFQEE